MNQIGEFLGQYATKEVLTVMGALATAWLGWKTAKGSYSMVASIAKKASFMGLASAGMLAVGLGVAGFGVGEINSRPSLKEDSVSTSHSTIGLSNKDLLEIVKAGEGGFVNPQVVQTILEYAKTRDEKTQQTKSSPQEPVLKAEELTIDPVKEATVNAEESIVSLPIAWSLIGIGIASSISGIAVFANRHNKRNSDDPNHPNFESQYKRA